MPKLSAGFGFGTNKQASSSANVYDIEFSAGISHSFDWEFNDFSFGISPSVLVNAGTNEYFSFLSLSKYISHSNRFNKYLKKPHIKKNGTNSIPQITKTTQSFSITNTEVNAESSIEYGSFSIRPSISFFLPVSSTTSQGIDKYWEVTISYSF